MISSKWGNCSQCGAQSTTVIKVKKDLFCVQCHKRNKAIQYTQRANEKVKVRSLHSIQKENGNMDSLQELIIDLDRVFSRWLRLSQMGADMKCSCFTCGVRLKWQEIHCGHYISRAHMATRWMEANNKCQCPTCNVTLHGNIEEYTKRLEAEQSGLPEYLQEAGREVTKFTVQDLKELLYNYQQKLNLVEKAKGIK